MHTRRDVLIIVPTIVTFSSAARAQEKAPTLVDRALNKLGEPPFVRQQHRILTYYIELLQKKPPSDWEAKEAETTHRIVGNKINELQGRADLAMAREMASQVAAEYEKRQSALHGFLTSVGIDPKSLATTTIEQAYVATLLYYLSVMRVRIGELKWCIWPFCFQKTG
jgi:hypothetical protein